MTELLFSGVGRFLPSSEGMASNPVVSTTTPATPFSSVLQRAIGAVQQSRIAEPAHPLPSVSFLSPSVLADHSIDVRRVAIADDITSTVLVMNGDNKNGNATPLPFQEEQSTNVIEQASNTVVSILIKLPPEQPNSADADATAVDPSKRELQQLQTAVDTLVRVVTMLHGQGQSIAAGEPTEAETGDANTIAEGAVDRIRVDSNAEKKGSDDSGIASIAKPQNSQDVSKPSEDRAMHQTLLGREGIKEEGRQNSEQQEDVATKSERANPEQRKAKLLIPNELVDGEEGAMKSIPAVVKAQEQLQGGKQNRVVLPSEKTVQEQPLQKGQNHSQPEKDVIAQRESILPQQTPTEQLLPLLEQTSTTQAGSRVPVADVPVVGLVNSVVHNAEKGRAEQPEKGADGHLVAQKGDKLPQIPVEQLLRVLGANPSVPKHSDRIVIDVPMVGSVAIVLRSAEEGTTHVDIAIPRSVPSTPDAFTALIRVVTQKIAEMPTLSHGVIADAGDAKSTAIEQHNPLAPLGSPVQGASLTGETVDGLLMPQGAAKPVLASRQHNSDVLYKPDIVLSQEKNAPKGPSPVVGETEEAHSEPSQPAANTPVPVTGKETHRAIAPEPLLQSGQQGGSSLRGVQTESPHVDGMIVPMQLDFSSVVPVGEQPYDRLPAARNAPPLVVSSLQFTFVSMEDIPTVQARTVESPQLAPVPVVEHSAHSTVAVEPVPTDASEKLPGEVLTDKTGTSAKIPMADNAHSGSTLSGMVQRSLQPLALGENQMEQSQKTPTGNLPPDASVKHEPTFVQPTYVAMPNTGDVPDKETGARVAVPTGYTNATSEDVVVPPHEGAKAQVVRTIAIPTNGQAVGPEGVEASMPMPDNGKKSVAQYGAVPNPVQSTEEQAKEVLAARGVRVEEEKHPTARSVPRTATILPVNGSTITTEEMFLPLRPSEKEHPDEQKIPAEQEPQPDTKAKVQPHRTEFVPERGNDVAEDVEKKNTSAPKMNKSIDETGGVNGEKTPLFSTGKQVFSVPDRGVQEENPVYTVETAIPAQKLVEPDVVAPSSGMKAAEGLQEHRGTERSALSAGQQTVQDDYPAQKLGERVSIVAPTLPEETQSEVVSPNREPTTPRSSVLSMPKGIAALDAVFRDIESRGGFSAHIDVPAVPQNGESRASMQVNNSQAYGNRQKESVVQGGNQHVPIHTTIPERAPAGLSTAPHEPLFRTDVPFEGGVPNTFGTTGEKIGAISNHQEVGMAIEARKQQDVIAAPERSAVRRDENTVMPVGTGKQQESEVPTREPQVDSKQGEKTEHSVRRENSIRSETPAAPVAKPLFTSTDEVGVGNPALLQQEKVSDGRKLPMAEEHQQSSTVVGEQKQTSGSPNFTTTEQPKKSDAEKPVASQAPTAERIAGMSTPEITVSNKGDVAKPVVTDVPTVERAVVPSVPTVEMPNKGDVAKPVVAEAPTVERVAVPTAPAVEMPNKGDVVKSVVAEVPTVERAVVSSAPEAGMPRKIDVPEPIRATAERAHVPEVIQPEEVRARVQNAGAKTERVEVPQSSSSGILTRPAIIAMATGQAVVPVRTTAGRLSANRSTEPWQDIVRKETGLGDAALHDLPLVEARTRFSLHGLRDTPESVYRDTAIRDKAMEKPSVDGEAQGTKVGGGGDEPQGSANGGDHTGHDEHKGMRPDAMSTRSVVPHQAKPAPSFMRSFSNVVPTDVPHIVQSVMRTAPSGAGGIVQMTLMPEALGEVVVALSVLNGVADVVIDTDNAESKRAVEAQLPVLKERLAQAGLQVEHMEVRTKQHDTVQGDASRSGRQGSQMQEEQKSRQEFLRSFRHLMSYEPTQMPDTRTVPPTPRQSHSGYFERYA